MTPEIAIAIARLLQRVDLKGAEVPAFAACMAELEKIANPPMQRMPPRSAGTEETADGAPLPGPSRSISR